MGGQLLASGVILLSVYQDMGLGARVGAGLGFFMAIASSVSALVTALQANLSGAAASCAVVVCSETLLILRWCGSVRSLHQRDRASGPNWTDAGNLAQQFRGFMFPAFRQ